MIGALIRGKGRILMAGFLPMDPINHDKVAKDIKTAKDFENKVDISESGLDRLKEMFKLDESGGISQELNSVYQAGFLGFLIGAIYGGVIYSRKSYMDFMESNEATSFKSPLDAKRKLQDQFTVNFAKGSVRWGWRVALFTTSYLGIITCISVYRGKSSIYEYLAAGGITGALFKMNLGLRGMTAGGIVGGALGTFAGAISLAVMKVSGTSMEEVRFWQHNWKKHRNAEIHAAIKKQDEFANSDLTMLHDENVGHEVSLENIK